MNPVVSLIPGYFPLPQTAIVSKEIAALELLPTHNGAHAGRITPVPQGTCLEVCGRGFTERTIQVRWEGRLGFVFLQDVDLREAVDPAVVP
jgi:hypothetical protein